MVEAGQGPLEIVCGASNFALGDLVPLAPVGAVLPGGFAIARRKMRGVTSNGMLCSGRELGLGDDHEGLLVLERRRGRAPGRAARPRRSASSADVVFDVTVEGNRPDAWCIAGSPATWPRASAWPSPPRAAGARRRARPADRRARPRRWSRTPTSAAASAVALLDRVAVVPRPAGSPARLRLAGMRPINNVVDASNYVMLELGQPTHPYDLDQLAQPGLRVRRARPGERLTTLDGVERELGRARAGPR